MRVYLPSAIPLLARVVARREVGPAPLDAFAVTPGLTESYATGDTDELEYAALCLAARWSLRLLDADLSAPRRRVVIAADVAPEAVEVLDSSSRGLVRVSVAVPWKRIAAAHVDDHDAEKVVAAAAAAVTAADLGDEDATFVVDEAEGYELLWWATQEIVGLV